LVSIRKEFVLTDEGDVGNFLGIKVERQKNGLIDLTQPVLIDKIIQRVGLESNSSYLPTPSSGPLLAKDSEGEECKHEFDYRAAVGIINSSNKYWKIPTRNQRQMILPQS
jgi:hypothetical protein